MPELFKNKYRIPSPRLTSWDYSQVASYFITICTKDRECFFGEIIKPPAVETRCIASLSNSPMRLSILGQTVETEWLKTKDLRPDMNLEIDEYVVMPNHFHGIISIGENEYNTVDSDNYKNTFRSQSKNLASIIRGFKSAVTTFARKNEIVFDWQPRFHEHIIRTNEDHMKISEYILNNPYQWQEDELCK